MVGEPMPPTGHDQQIARTTPRRPLQPGVAGIAGIRPRLRQRLGWRITASNALVTIVALTVIELVLFVGAAVAVGIALNGNGGAVIEDLGRAAPAVAPLLASGTPDATGIDRWLRQVQINGLTATADQHVQLRPDAPELAKPDTQLLVIDDNGRIVGALKQVSVPVVPQPVSSVNVPGLSNAGAAARAGRASATKFLQWPPPERLTVAVPVRSGQGAVVGALVFSARWRPLNASFAVIGRVLATTALAFVVAGAIVGTIAGYVAARPLTRRLDRMSAAAAAWGSGDFSASVADPSEDELGQLGRRLDRMAEQLADLISTRARLSAVDERNRLARDLHDSVKQQAFAVSMHLGSARAVWDRDPTAARKQLEAAYEIARQSQQELSSIIQTLRPIPSPTGLSTTRSANMSRVGRRRPASSPRPRSPGTCAFRRRSRTRSFA